MRVAVIGTGIMGAAMAANLSRAGHDVVVWNRTRSKADAVAERDGVDVTVTDTPATAAAGADAVVTMLFDRAAVEAAATGPDGFFAAGGRPVWVQSSTVGTEVDELAMAADDLGWPFVDAPVLGTRGPAEEGTLTTLVSGAPEHREAVAPLFEAWGSRTLVAGDAPGEASRLKIVVNSWLAGQVAAVAETITAARRVGVDPQLFLDTIEGTPVGSPYAAAKGGFMVREEFPTQMPLVAIAKDMDLVLDVAVGGPPLAGLEAARATAQRAIEDGHGQDDMASIIEAMSD